MISSKTFANNRFNSNAFPRMSDIPIREGLEKVMGNDKQKGFAKGLNQPQNGAQGFLPIELVHGPSSSGSHYE